MSILKLLGSSSFLMANKEIVKATDLECAVLLSDLAGAHDYWKEKNLLQDGYFFRTQSEIEQNTTLSAKVQLRCLKLLISKGILKTKLKGAPPVKYFCIDEKAINTIISQTVEIDLSKKENLNTTNGIIQDVQKGEFELAEMDNLNSTKGRTNNNRINNNKGIIIDNNNKEKSDFSFLENDPEIIALNDKKQTQEVLPAVVYQKPKKEKAPQIYPANFSPAIIRAVENFIEYRKEIKKPFKSEKSQQTKVNQWSDQIEAYGDLIVLDSIETAIANGWQGTFIDMKKVEQLNKQQTNSDNQFKTKKDANFAHYFSQLRDVDYGFND